MHALLGLDLGTTGVKAALFAAEDGHLLSTAFVDYPLLHPQPGWAEQNPADWWQATVVAIRTCLAQAALHDVPPADVQGVGLSGQMHGVVLLDERQQVLRPSIIWADQRSEAQCRWITERAPSSPRIAMSSARRAGANPTGWPRVPLARSRGAATSAPAAITSRTARIVRS